MKLMPKSDRGFTLVELLVVMAALGILAGLLFPVLGAAKDKARRTDCLSNLRQINAGLRMYSDDSSDVSPTTKTNWGWGIPSVAYKELMKSYVGLKGRSSPQERIFACPADTFYYQLSYDNWYFHNAPWHDSEDTDYSSYLFNGFNVRAVENSLGIPWLGIAGLKMSSIKEPSKTMLVAEDPAFYPYSWHLPETPIQLSPGEWPLFNDAKDMVSFVDGHVNYIKIYYRGFLACWYNPPAGYDYKWSGD